MNLKNIYNFFILLYTIIYLCGKIIIGEEEYVGENYCY